MGSAALEDLSPGGYEGLLAIDQAVLDALCVAVYVCAPDGEIVRYNANAAALWGRAPRVGGDERFCGAFRLWADDKLIPRTASPMAEVLCTGQRMRDREIVVQRADGTRSVVVMSIEPLTSGARVQGAIACFHDITARKAAEAAQSRLAAIVESSQDAIVSKDLHGVVTSWNAGARRLFGYAPEEIVGRSVTMLMLKGREDEELRILERIRCGQTVDHYETVRRRKDGSLVDISLTVSPIKDANGRVIGASKIARDITERKRTDAERDLLVAELSHRVKNTLATVVSIARQSFAKNPNVDEARRAFDARILALAQTHTRLAEANWSGVSLETVLLDEVAPYRRSDGRNVRLSGPPVTLTPKSVVTLGLAVHELVTNAAKYGALSTSDGVVDIAWRRDQGDALVICWTERGGPPVAEPARTGFGRQLLQRAMTAGLKGGVELDFPRDGVRCEIRIPLGSAKVLMQ